MADSHEMQTSVDSAVDSVNSEIGDFLVFSATFNKEKEQKLGEVQSSKSVCVTIAKSTKASQKVRVMGSYPLSVQLKAGLVSVGS